MLDSEMIPAAEDEEPVDTTPVETYLPGHSRPLETDEDPCRMRELATFPSEVVTEHVE
jgi:hypothetical protein